MRIRLVKMTATHSALLLRSSSSRDRASKSARTKFSSAGSSVTIALTEAELKEVCISAAPAALDRYLAALPAMSLIPFAPLYLGSSRCVTRAETSANALPDRRRLPTRDRRDQEKRRAR